MKPLRIIHILGSLHEGGVGQAVTRLYRALDRNRFSFLACVERIHGSAEENAWRDLGGDIVPYGRSRNAADAFSSILDHRGADVVHLHRVPYRKHTCVPLRIARERGVPVRILHLRISSERYPLVCRAPDGLPPVDRLLRRWQAWQSSRRLADTACATHILAVSEKAFCSYFGPHWAEDPRAGIAYSGIELEPFFDTTDRAAMRTAFGIPHDATVLMHVGGFRRIKNQAFLVDTLAALRHMLPNAVAVFVGGGEEQHKIMKRAESLGCGAAAFFPGQRGDVPRLLTGLGDIFVLPSLLEGLSGALLEAQAAGLPCLASDQVTAEGVALPGRVRFLPLADGPEAWAHAIRAMLAETPRIAPATAVASLRGGPFDIRAACERMERIYASALTRPSV